MLHVVNIPCHSPFGFITIFIDLFIHEFKKRQNQHVVNIPPFILVILLFLYLGFYYRFPCLPVLPVLHHSVGAVLDGLDERTH